MPRLYDRLRDCTKENFIQKNKKYNINKIRDNKVQM